MNYHSAEQLKKTLEDLEDALEGLDQLSSESHLGESISREAFLLLKGSTEEVVALWLSQHKYYFFNSAGDLVRRRLMLQNDRYDLWEPLHWVAHPRWSMEDVFLVPPGPSDMRAELLVRSPDDLPMVGDFDSMDFPEEHGSPHRLLVAVALYDGKAVRAVEQTPWIMNETSDNLEDRLRGEGALMALAVRPLSPENVAFVRQQWELARSGGTWNVSDQPLDETSASLFRVLSRKSRATSTEDLLRQVIQVQGGGAVAAMELFRDIVWQSPPAIAARCWAAACASCPELLRLPPKPGAPFLQGVAATSDPFLMSLEAGRLPAGKRMFEQWAKPSFTADVVDDQSQEWIRAVVSMIDKRLPKQHQSFNGQAKADVAKVRDWMDEEGAWPFNHLSSDGWQRLGRWTQQATATLEALCSFQASDNAEEEYRALRLQVGMLITFLPRVTPLKPRF